MIHWNTRNQSFIKMHFNLKQKGISNNAFFLTLLDPELEFVDPYDSNLTRVQKARILNEIINNYWYFLREVVRIQTPGGAKMYELNSALLAFHYLSELNINIYIEIARQLGKTTAVLVRKLYTYNFRARNSKILFFHKTHSESKSNLNELKKIRDSLPPYLRMESLVSNGKKLKAKNSVESIQHVINQNMILTMPSASSEEKADSLGRGKTATEIYFDEHAFMKYNNIVYTAVMPAFIRASNISKEQNNPYGVVITTTAGSRNRDYAEYSYQFKENATKWHEGFYDYTPEAFYQEISKNKKSDFVYIKYQYYELGYSRKWLENVVIQLGNDWSKIRREFLLEWEYENKDNPFDTNDLEIIDNLKKEPINKLRYGSHIVNIYENYDLRYLEDHPPIIGVDVAGSESRMDSSAITIIDSLSTKVIATLNSNYIGYRELSNIIIDLVRNYYPRAIVNIERNGGFGDSLIEHLKPYIKSNLYWELVDSVVEERSGLETTLIKKKRKRFGTNSSGKVRSQLMNILYNRVELHKDKFICPIIVSELKTLTTKKSGKIEHSVGNHDDQIFSYLMALYVWYEGKNLTEKYGISKRPLETDEFSNNIDEEIQDIKIDNTDYNLQRNIMSYYSNNEIINYNDPNKVMQTTNYTTNTIQNNNISIPNEYLNTSKVYTLENHLINTNNSSLRKGISNSNFYIDNKVDESGNKNFWEF